MPPLLLCRFQIPGTQLPIKKKAFNKYEIFHSVLQPSCDAAGSQCHFETALALRLINCSSCFMTFPERAKIGGDMTKRLAAEGVYMSMP